MRIITVSDEELQAFADLIDAGVRHLGLQSVEKAAALLARLKQAKEVKEDDNTD